MRNAKREDVFFFLLPAALIYSSALSVSAWDFIRRQENLNTLSAQSIIGFLLIIFGLIINIVSACTLRQFYSSTLVIKEGHQLIKHGIYNLTRHPIYLGSIMASMGVPIFVSSLYGFLAMSLLIPFFFYRISIEERMLIEEFGDKYRTYCETTRKLIPFIF